MKSLFWIVLSALLLSFGHVACGGDDTSSNSDADSDTDTDSDSDSDTDTDTDTDSDSDADGGTDCTQEAEYVACDGVPTSCEEIGADTDAQYYGCCEGVEIYYCQDGTLGSGSCPDIGYPDCCYSSEAGTMDCV
jgi:hypothetical protein